MENEEEKNKSTELGRCPSEKNSLSKRSNDLEFFFIEETDCSRIFLARQEKRELKHPSTHERWCSADVRAAFHESVHNVWICVQNIERKISVI